MILQIYISDDLVERLKISAQGDLPEELRDNEGAVTRQMEVILEGVCEDAILRSDF